MAIENTLTGLLPIIYKAMDVVAREQIGFIPAVTIDAAVSAAAKGQTVRSPVVGPASVIDVVPGMTVPSTGAATLTYKEMTLSNFKAAEVVWTAEQEKALGTNFESILVDQFAQGFRAISNLVEQDVANVAYLNAGYAYGIGGAVANTSNTPFGVANDLSDFAQLDKILNDTGAPKDGRHLVLGSTAMANLKGKQSVLYKASEAGTDQLLREGSVSKIQGFWMHDSNKVQSPTSGSITANVALANVGETVISVSGTPASLVQGDVITIAGDSTKYVVASKTVAPNTVTLNMPITKAVSANALISVVAASPRNIALHKSAIVLAARPPYINAKGGQLLDSTEVTDPVSGITFLVSEFAGYYGRRFEIALVWGAGLNKSDFIAVSL